MMKRDERLWQELIWCQSKNVTFSMEAAALIEASCRLKQRQQQLNMYFKYKGRSILSDSHRSTSCGVNQRKYGQRHSAGWANRKWRRLCRNRSLMQRTGSTVLIVLQPG
ncbi:hypothetical protein F2P81_004921 [Scophthalmus maximus]|uniref:Uncharacterized protein n=1 Tax=Scophthalmus maximus TaxID=52904 RepID=A0A6A4TK38_SCOMX|nr:hypothetical protein F2P81_004921 [Scophthalmus maximus]